MDVTLVEGDLLEQPVDCIVNAWNRNIIPWWLLIPHGVSGAIKKRAGTKPFQEIGSTGPLPLGHARKTSAGNLPFKAIIHVASIDMLWNADEASITNSVINAMKLAESEGFRSIAFPILGAGSGRFNAKQAEDIMRNAFARINSDLDVCLVRYKNV
jgi:O-acetyl-ADP-ribose deacetylase (regulator of RNase III)